MTRFAIAAHAVPFLAWMLVLAVSGEPSAWKYAARVLAGAAALLALRPWRWYAAMQWRHLPLALAAGAGVFLVWVGPETAWFGERWPGLQAFYRRFAIVGSAPRSGPPPYAPEVCGWPLASVRLLGSGLVIATIEEFFWRGFLYRMVQARDFLRVDPRGLAWGPFLIVAALFAVEHDRWLAGLLAGLAYGGLALRTGDLWCAVCAHATTNLLLGAYVLAAGAWQFW